MLSCDIRECIGERPGYRSCGRAEAVVVAPVVKVLRQDDQSSAARGGLGREGGGAIDVRLDVTGRIELDEGDGQPNGGIVRGGCARA